MRSIKLNQKGDTIVEVLIAMVILAFVLTGAYESSQYSLNNIRNSENRITAINLASSQIEALKSWVATNPVTPNLNSTFYMNAKNYTVISAPQTQGNFFYQFSIPQQESIPINTNYTFTINVYWQDLNANSVTNVCNAQNILTPGHCDNISISYRTAI